MKRATWAAMILSLPLFVAAQDATRGVWDLEFAKVTENVYVACRPDPFRVPVEGNVTIILTDRDVVVVDSGGAPAAARQTIAFIRKLTDKPVRVLVNTHGHGDHTLGNQEFAKAFPELEIVAHPGTRNYMVGGGLNYVAEVASPEGVRARQDEEKAAMRAAREQRGPGVEKVLAFHAAYSERDIFVRSREYKTVHITPPTSTFTGTYTLHRGSQEIQFLHLGYGNTASDVVVYLRREKVLITGDMVTHPFPYGFSRGPVQWANTLETLAALDFEYLVPGHGKVLRGAEAEEFLRDFRGLFDFCIKQVRLGLQQGLEEPAIRQRIDFSPWLPRFAGTDPVQMDRFRAWFTDPIVGRIVDELRGGPSR